MKQKFIIVCITLLTLSLSINSIDAKEDSIISFDGNAKDFIYVHEDAKGFTNFEGLLPGETRKQTITLKNDDYQELRFYIHSKIVDQLGGDAQNKVIYDVNFLINDVPLFQGTIGGNENVGMQNTEDSSLLATLQKGESVDVTMILSSDGDSMNDEYQGSQGTVQFTFSVEHDDTASTNTINTVVNYVNHLISTGDSTAILYLICLTGVSLLVIILVMKKGGTKNEK